MSAATINDADALLALGDNPQGDIDTMFVLLSGFLVRPCPIQGTMRFNYLQSVVEDVVNESAVRR
jgi:hypothetical protein